MFGGFGALGFRVFGGIGVRIGGTLGNTSQQGPFLREP